MASQKTCRYGSDRPPPRRSYSEGGSLVSMALLHSVNINEHFPKKELHLIESEEYYHKNAKKHKRSFLKGQQKNPVPFNPYPCDPVERKVFQRTQPPPTTRIPRNSRSYNSFLNDYYYHHQIETGDHFQAKKSSETPMRTIYIQMPLLCARNPRDLESISNDMFEESRQKEMEKESDENKWHHRNTEDGRFESKAAAAGSTVTSTIKGNGVRGRVLRVISTNDINSDRKQKQSLSEKNENDVPLSTTSNRPIIQIAAYVNSSVKKEPTIDIAPSNEENGSEKAQRKMGVWNMDEYVPLSTEQKLNSKLKIAEKRSLNADEKMRISTTVNLSNYSQTEMKEKSKDEEDKTSATKPQLLTTNDKEIETFINGFHRNELILQVEQQASSLGEAEVEDNQLRSLLVIPIAEETTENKKIRRATYLINGNISREDDKSVDRKMTMNRATQKDNKNIDVLLPLQELTAVKCNGESPFSDQPNDINTSGWPYSLQDNVEDGNMILDGELNDKRNVSLNVDEMVRDALDGRSFMNEDGKEEKVNSLTVEEIPTNNINVSMTCEEIPTEMKQELPCVAIKARKRANTISFGSDISGDWTHYLEKPPRDDKAAQNGTVVKSANLQTEVEDRLLEKIHEQRSEMKLRLMKIEDSSGSLPDLLDGYATTERRFLDELSHEIRGILIEYARQRRHSVDVIRNKFYFKDTTEEINDSRFTESDVNLRTQSSDWTTTKKTDETTTENGSVLHYYNDNVSTQSHDDENEQIPTDDNDDIAIETSNDSNSSEETTKTRDGEISPSSADHDQDQLETDKRSIVNTDEEAIYRELSEMIRSTGSGAATSVADSIALLLEKKDSKDQSTLADHLKGIVNILAKQEYLRIKEIFERASYDAFRRRPRHDGKVFRPRRSIRDGSLTRNSKIIKWKLFKSLDDEDGEEI